MRPILLGVLAVALLTKAVNAQEDTASANSILSFAASWTDTRCSARLPMVGMMITPTKKNDRLNCAMKGLIALTAATPILHRESLSPRVKSLNYLSHILAKVEGIAANVDEVIMLDSAGYVAEASGMNLFAVSNSTLRTPPPYTGILRGVTRDTVMENYWDRAQPIFPSGQIELQNHGDQLWFKNIYLRELP